jgi:drug/metabolite transporter (DMT)-like permease
MLVIALLVSGSATFAAVPANWIPVAALGLFATALPIVLFMHILRRAGPTVGAMNGYLVPFWTILLGLVFLGETVERREIAGCLVVLAGVMIVSSTGRRAPRSAAPAQIEPGLGRPR